MSVTILYNKLDHEHYNSSLMSHLVSCKKKGLVKVHYTAKVANDVSCDGSSKEQHMIVVSSIRH